MFEKLATFVFANRRRMLFVAVIGVAIAGVFGDRGVEAPESVRRR